MKDTSFREFIDDLKSRVNIVEVVGRHVKLTNGRGLCPFHAEKTPSFVVNTAKQYFHCFGCRVGGDVIEFLKLVEDKPFMLILTELAAEVDMELPAWIGSTKKDVDEKMTVQKILNMAGHYYHSKLTSEVREYLIQKRGLTEEIIGQFLLGYADGGLRDYLVLESKLPAALCVKAGVLRRKKNGQVVDFFDDHITIPNLRLGQVVHLTGRRRAEAGPKFLHLPGAIEFLFNEDSLRHDDVLVTEGPFDCIAAEQAGFHAVGLYGTGSFKREYVSRFVKCTTVYVCMDGDAPGKEAAKHVAELLGDRARIVTLPDSVDVNEYLTTNSSDDFKMLLAASKDLVTSLVEQIPADTSKSDLPAVMAPALKLIAGAGKPKAEAYLNHLLKDRFDLKREEVSAYRSHINALRHQIETEMEPAEEMATDDMALSAYFEGLVDLVEDDGKVNFLVSQEGRVSMTESFRVEGEIVLPPPRKSLPWLLPRGSEVLKHLSRYENNKVTDVDRELFDDLVTYHRAISELPSDAYYDLFGAWDLHTYLMERFEYSPVICLFAVPERGKSRTGKGMIYVAHRGIHVESLRDAYIVRVANDLRCSLFFDVQDLWKKAEKAGSEDVVLHRFEKGGMVPRVLWPDKGAFHDTKYFQVFGPTIIGTNEGVHHILETRCLTISMPEGKRRFEEDVTPQQGLSLKERLVAFRAQHLTETLPKVEKPAAGRLGDIVKPLLQVLRLVNPDCEPRFLNLVRDIEESRKIERGESLEAQILVAILKLQHAVENGKLKISRITEQVNYEKTERSKISDRTIGRRLSAMGFAKIAWRDGSRAILHDDERINRMVEAYGVGQVQLSPETPGTLFSPIPPATSVPSVPPGVPPVTPSTKTTFSDFPKD